MTTRLLVRSDGPFPLTTTNPFTGRSYTAAAAGATLDVPDSEAPSLVGNGWLLMGLVGPTTARPVNNQVWPHHPYPNQDYYDTSISAWIVWDGATWRNAATGAAV
jgi:hypothetical protein